MGGEELDREVRPEYVRMYYEHQYDRMAKLEEQRLIITNIVLALSIAAFSFGFSNIHGLTIFTGLGIPVVLGFSNYFAIAYLAHSEDVIKAHKKRAKRALELYANDLYQLDTDKHYQWSKRWWPRWKIQLSIHIILIFIALFLAYTYLRVII